MKQVAFVVQVKANEAREEKAIQPIQAVGGVKQVMTQQEIEAFLATIHGETADDKNDGTRIHIHYKSFGMPTAQAIACAQRASQLGLASDRYTGRVKRVWLNKVGEQCLTVLVELERDHLYRTFNLVRGQVFCMVKLGE